MTDNDATEGDPTGGEGAPSDAVEVRGPAPPAVVAEDTGVMVLLDETDLVAASFQ